MGNKLQEIRESKGLSISELSRRSNISRQTIYSLEAEEVDKANLQTLKSLADALGVKVTDFFIE